MNDGDDRPGEFQVLLRAHVMAKGECLEWHPSLDELEGYRAGSLTESELGRIRAHLPYCRDCADFVLGAVAVAGVEGPEADDAAAKEELQDVWSGLQKSLQEVDPPAPVAVRAASPSRRLLLLAAVLAAAVVGLGAWSMGLQRRGLQRAGEIARLSGRLAEAERREEGLTAREAVRNRQVAELQRDLDGAQGPRINTAILDLAPRTARGVNDAERLPMVPPGVDLFTLLLSPEDGRTFPGYAVEVLDGDGRRLWFLQGLVRTEFGNFTLTLARSTLPKGRIRLRLYGTNANKRIEIAKYVLSVP